MLVLSDCAVHIYQNLIAFYTTCCLSCLMVIMCGHLDRQFTDQTKHRGDTRVMCRHHRRARLERSVLWAEKAQTTLAVSQENGNRSGSRCDDCYNSSRLLPPYRLPLLSPNGMAA